MCSTCWQCCRTTARKVSSVMEDRQCWIQLWNTSLHLSAENTAVWTSGLSTTEHNHLQHGLQFKPNPQKQHVAFSITESVIYIRYRNYDCYLIKPEPSKTDKYYPQANFSGWTWISWFILGQPPPLCFANKHITLEDADFYDLDALPLTQPAVEKH